MKIVTVKIEDLKPAEYNPRQMTKVQHKHLTESIKKFGLVDPILVNSHPDRKNVIIGGHQRVKIAKELEIKEVPVVYIELDQKKEKELNLRLNKNLGEFDFDMLANEFDMKFLKDIGFTKSDFGFTGDDDMDKGKMTITLTVPLSDGEKALGLVEDVANKIEGTAKIKTRKYVKGE